jgi:glycosyltransferase involved in cell wall biosynthesis
MMDDIKRMDNKSGGILHINLARGWRGGEQQTWLLMEVLADRGYIQGLCAYDGAQIAQAAESLPNVRILTLQQCILFPFSVGSWQIAHAHEARGVYIAWWLKRLLGIPYVITRRMQQSPHDRGITRRAYGSADRLVGISSAACASMELFAQNQRVKCIPSAHSGQHVDVTSAIANRSSLTVHDGTTLIGHAGALRDSHKGQRVLIDAGQQLRSRGYAVEIALFGEGPDRNALEREVDGLAWVHLVGEVAPIQDYLGALDIFAFPSRHEGLGSVLLEAMLAEVPIVATRVGGIPDVIKDLSTGLLVQANDSEALCNAIAALIDNPDRARELARQAYILARSMDAQSMAKKYTDIYSVIGGAPSLGFDSSI